MAANTKHRKNHKQKVTQFKLELRHRRQRAVKDYTNKMNEFIMEKMKEAQGENMSPEATQ